MRSLLVGALLAVTALPALADPVMPDATLSTQYVFQYFNPGPLTQVPTSSSPSGSLSYSGVNNSGQGIFNTVQTPQPQITAIATATTSSSATPNVALTDVNATMTYYLYITGPQIAPVHIRALGTSTITGTSSGDYARQTFYLTGQGSDGRLVNLSGQTDLSFDGTVSLNTNEYYAVFISADAKALAPGGAVQSESATSVIDPLFSIDSSLGDPSQYRFFFSAGIGNSVGNVGAVPGPVVGAGLPGLIAAFGGLLAWRRRRATSKFSVA